jgi:hypothetical protein
MADRIIWHIAANPRRQPCGCAEWDQWSAAAQAWLHRVFRCAGHAGT